MSHRKFALFALVALSLVSCKTSISVVSVDDAAFREMWERNWAEISSHMTPLIPTDNSPGVCNIGGSANGCYDVSATLLGDFQSFAADLEGTEVPESYAQGAATLERALEAGVDGFRTRMRAFEKGRDADLVRANDLLGSASALIQQAYAELPVETRPSPPPGI